MQLFYQFFLELVLRFVGFDKFVLYYPSNYYGYYHEPNQNILSRHGKSISFDKIGNRNPNNNNIENSELIFLETQLLMVEVLLVMKRHLRI